MEHAYFVRRPRTAADLTVLHPLEAEQAYEIIGWVRLSKLDYENFITDMLVERAFLSPFVHLCGETPHMKCVCVERIGHIGGILVVTEKTAHVKWAAQDKKLGRLFRQL